VVLLIGVVLVQTAIIPLLLLIQQHMALVVLVLTIMVLHLLMVVMVNLVLFM